MWLVLKNVKTVYKKNVSKEYEETLLCVFCAILMEKDLDTKQLSTRIGIKTLAVLFGPVRSPTIFHPCRFKDIFLNQRS